jgi:hypothetical protein
MIILRLARLWHTTAHALLGLNVESSLVVKLSDSSRLSCEAVQYLEEIKAICDVFDPSRVEFYKRLQGEAAERTVRAIELEAPDAEALGGASITVFGTDPNELKDAGPLRDIYLSVFDESTAKEHLYSPSVVQSGLMPGYEPAASGLSFGARRHAFRRGSKFPKLLPTKEVSDDVLQHAA